MKTRRMSRNCENRNARKEMIARGAVRKSLADAIPAEVAPSSRTWRRAVKNRCARLNIPVPGHEDLFDRPMSTTRWDIRGRRILEGQNS